MRSYWWHNFNVKYYYFWCYLYRIKLQNTLTKGIVVYEEVLLPLCFRKPPVRQQWKRELQTLTSTIKHVPLKHIVRWYDSNRPTPDGDKHIESSGPETWIMFQHDRLWPISSRSWGSQWETIQDGPTSDYRGNLLARSRSGQRSLLRYQTEVNGLEMAL